MFNWRRRSALQAIAVFALGLPETEVFAAAPVVEVWKDPGCGCCGLWVKHLEASGFRVKVNDTGNNAVRARLARSIVTWPRSRGVVAGLVV